MPNFLFLPRKCAVSDKLSFFGGFHIFLFSEYYNYMLNVREGKALGEYVINGGRRLKGAVTVNGSKNAVLPILAASVLNGSMNVLENCPEISDVKTSKDILKYIGCSVETENKTIIVNSSCVRRAEIPAALVKKMRSSIVFMGPLIARFKKASLSHPGGCALGKRPIDMHLSALKKMGVEITEENDMILCECGQLKGCNINLSFPSVGATENIILAAVLAKGDTIISNCAAEPEITDLCRYLSKIGAKIYGAGTPEIKITGVKELKPAVHTIIPDRIEAGTYMIMTAAAGGKVLLKNVIPAHLSALSDILSKMGCKIKTAPSSILIKASGKLYNTPIVKTLPYPGFPTDLQPQLTALASLSDGMCAFSETIFESRTAHIEELKKMGADISLINEHEFTVKGVNGLRGAEVSAKDLRGGAALIVAGLAAGGASVVKNSCHIERGYENLALNLQSLGADIVLKPSADYPAAL